MTEQDKKYAIERAQYPWPDAIKCLEDVISHHGDFTSACREVKASNETSRDDEAYWQKQIDVLDRMKTQAVRALNALAEPPAPTIAALPPSAGSVPADFPYPKTFNAIAAATSVSGGQIAVSVAKFVESFNAPQANAQATCKPGGCSAIGCEGGNYCFDENGVARPKADPNAVARAIFPNLTANASADVPDAIEATFYTARNNTLAEFKKRILAFNAKDPSMAELIHRLNDATNPVDAADRNLIIRALSTAPTTGSAPVAFYRDVQYDGSGDVQREYNGINEFSGGGTGFPLYAEPIPNVADGYCVRPVEPCECAPEAMKGCVSFRAAPASPAAIRPTREHAEKAISEFLKGELGEVPNFTLTEDGDEDSGDKCGWAFWVLSDDTTSYLHRNLKIEWYGTAHAPEPKIAASPAASVLSEDAILAIAIDHGLGTAVVESIVKALLAASMGGDRK